MKGIIERIDSFFWAILLICPDTPMFWRLRAKKMRSRGNFIGENVRISPNVRVSGKFSIGNESSIAHNCTISGESVGVAIGDFVMIAPGCTIVAFDHGFSSLEVPMLKQVNVEAGIIIENDVWIGSNCTITKGIKIGRGSIVAANSVVRSDIEPYSIYGGVPAKFIKSRISK